MDVNNFNFIAPFYDQLARLVFGKSILKAQLTHLPEIKGSDRVLILGGGTGKLLEHFPFCESIDYVEKSKSMIRKAKKRLVNRSINFHQQDFFEFESQKKYDVIVCPFFLDCFNESNLRFVIAKCKRALKEQGRLIVADFEPKRDSREILSLMHFFFRIIANLESGNLQNINEKALKAGFELVEEKFLHRNQLFSRLYRNL